MKATWKRTVTRVGEEPKNDNFFSLYQPPAKFHKQEVFPAKPLAGTKPEDIKPFVGTPTEN